MWRGMFVPDVYSQRAVMASVPWPSAPALHMPLLNRGRGGISNQLQIAAPKPLSPRRRAKWWDPQTGSIRARKKRF